MGDEKLSCDVIFCPEVSGDTYEVSWVYEHHKPISLRTSSHAWNPGY